MNSNLKLKISNFLLELFFPSFCLGCQKEGVLICYDCKSILEISEYNYCLCDKAQRLLQAGGGKCQRCQSKTLNGLYFALPYQEKALTKRLIYQFKYEPYIKTLAKPLAAIVAEHLLLAENNKETIWKNSILIPVPLHVSKAKERGYNQSQELTRELGHLINVSPLFNTLIKIKKTKPQMELSAKDRRKNLQDAFVIKNPAIVQGKKIFLVDDVYTTGATMAECAKTLKEAGAKEVWGIAIARDE